MKDNISLISNEHDEFHKKSPHKISNNEFYFEENDQSYKRNHGFVKGRRKFSEEDRNYSYGNNLNNSYKRKDNIDYRRGGPIGNTINSNQYDSKVVIDKYRKDDYNRNYDYKDELYFRRPQMTNQYMSQNPQNSLSHQKINYKNIYEQDMRRKERSRSRSRSYESKKNKNNFPIICNINRSYFKSFDDHFHEIKREIIEKVNNLDEFRLKNFRETPESYILIDSFNFQAAKKAFKIYLEKTFDFLIGLFQKVSFLKICLLVPNRKLIKYIFN